MISDLCGEPVLFVAYHDEDRTTGEGIIRAVYVSRTPGQVARVLVQVTRVDTGDKCTVGELVDLNCQQVSMDVEAPKAAAVLSTPLLPILDRDYSVRTYNVARDNGLLTLGDLADRTPAGLLRMRNLGRKVLNDFRAVLAAHGLRLRGEP